MRILQFFFKGLDIAVDITVVVIFFTFFKISQINLIIKLFHAILNVLFFRNIAFGDLWLAKWKFTISEFP